MFDAEAAKGDFVMSAIAARVRDQLRATNPQLLEDWLHENEVTLLAHAFGKHVQSQRAISRRRAPARQFAQAVAGGASGVELTSMFDVSYCIDSNLTWRRMGDMTGVDHLYVAGQYHNSARTDLMLAAFHEAVAKKVRQRRTQDVFNETQLQRLYDSITGAYSTAKAV